MTFIISLVHTKGGVGKTMLTSQIQAGLSRQKDTLGRPLWRVGVIDANGGQGTLTKRTRRKSRYDVAQPQMRVLSHARKPLLNDCHDADASALERAIKELLQGGCTVIMIDSPGIEDQSRSEFPLLAAEWADVIVTPSQLDSESVEQIAARLRDRPAASKSDIVKGRCADIVSDASAENDSARWLVVPNRTPAELPPWRMAQLRLLEGLAPELGFELGSPIVEREAYPAAAAKGLTPLDMAIKDLRRSVPGFDAAERAEIAAETNRLLWEIAPQLADPAAHGVLERRLDLTDQLKAS